MARTLSTRGSAARSILSVTLAAATVAATFSAAPAKADHLDGFAPGWEQQPEWAGESSHRRVYRDEVGRFIVRRGEKHYIQFWDEGRTPGHWQPHHPQPQPVEQPRRKRDKTAEAAIIAGIAGLVVGGIIAGSQQQPQRVIAQPQPHRQPLPRPVPNNAFPERPRDISGPRVVTIERAFEPWTEGWADWCRARYRSFDIRTGTYTGYDGVKRFCEVK
jgi:hypothetical protein